MLDLGNRVSGWRGTTVADATEENVIEVDR
jgi:hypothetical protein